MARPGFRKVKSSGGQVVAGTLMAAVAIALIGAAIWAYTDCDTCQPRRLTNDLCPVSGPVGYVAIVIDTTDRVSPLAQTEIDKVLSALLDEMTAGTKLGLYLVEDQTEAAPDGAARMAALCHPGRPEDVNILTESRRDAQEVFQTQFLTPIDAALARMLAADSSKSSPIAEAIRVAVADLLPYGDPSAPQTVILVSDMIQNSASFSFFRGDRWQNLSTAAKESLSAPLQDADIRLIQILRPDFWKTERSFDADDVSEFWRDLLAQGQVERVERVAQVPAK
ncbi:MAG: hypothetical protein ABJI96_16790 [Paracoccaceae bacterium]